jgi:release factor glutamine methyltransferase
MIEWGEKYFQEKNIESPKLNIELIVRHVLGFDRLALYTKYDRPFNQTELDMIREMVKRRISGEPLQYIIGYTEFVDLDIKCDKRALIPRPETEEMVDSIITGYLKNRNSPSTILDIGTGSGCIALALASEFNDAKVVAIDISQDALDLAKHNAIRNKIENIELHKADILEVAPKGQYDLVVSNPPYIPEKDAETLETEVIDHEPKIALLKDDGLVFYERIVTLFKDIVSVKGEMWFEFGKDQEPEIARIVSQNSLKVEFFKDMQKIYRYCRIERNPN